MTIRYVAQAFVSGVVVDASIVGYEVEDPSDLVEATFRKGSSPNRRCQYWQGRWYATKREAISAIHEVFPDVTVRETKA